MQLRKILDYKGSILGFLFAIIILFLIWDIGAFSVGLICSDGYEDCYWPIRFLVDRIFLLFFWPLFILLLFSIIQKIRFWIIDRKKK